MNKQATESDDLVVFFVFKWIYETSPLQLIDTDCL